MSVVPMRPTSEWSHRSFGKAGRVYAIAFDIDTTIAERLLGQTWKSVYGKIERALESHGFKRMQGSLYFGTAESNAISCVKAVQELDGQYVWFGRIVKDLRMLRIDEDNDLLPVLSNRLRFDQADCA